jgi:hypothetical protein
MTILNLQSDGLPPVLITLALTVSREKEILRDNLIDICAPFAEASERGRLRATLTRWIGLGLFSDEGDKIRLSFSRGRGESDDGIAQRLPTICRGILLGSEHARPLWPNIGIVSEDNIGRSADLCRGLAWCLAQDIYTLPSTYADVNDIVDSQVQFGRFIFLNDTRWSGIRPWARYLGFATGDDSKLFFDPTVAVRGQLNEMIQKKESLPAAEFVARLAARLPVLDNGSYRSEVEQALKPETWRPPSPGHISTSLSFALRRLQKQGTIALESKADAGSRLALTGQFGRTWESFTHVRLLRVAE